MSTKKDQVADTAWMKEAFIDVQTELALKLKRAAQSIEHAGTHGTVNEDHWIEIFRSYLPNRYEVATGFVIDSLGNRSDQIDIVIFDRHFTPTLLDQQKHRYIPAEAVYGVFESKPHFDKAYLEYAGQKAASVRKLHRTSVSIAHAGGSFKPKEPFPIISGIVAPKSSWADGLGSSFQRHLLISNPERLDCGCALEHGAFDTFDGKLNLVGSEGALIHFLFRLLSKLQSLGSVPAIDWSAYAEIINSR
jgi:hypothetical protein